MFTDDSFYKENKHRSKLFTITPSAPVFMLTAKQRQNG